MDLYCYAFVEDMPSAALISKLVEYRNAQLGRRIIFHSGFPSIMNGFGAIKIKCKAFLDMAKAGIHTLVLTDLDTAECAVNLLRDWFSIPQDDNFELPPQCFFRVAVREVESWILADHAAWAKYIGIPAGNFSKEPDQLADPKKHLLNVLKKKGTKKVHREMLPQRNAYIGPRYNDVLCEFVNTLWVPDRASVRSPSLNRAINALMKI